MLSPGSYRRKILHVLPVAGIVLYIIFYSVSAVLYPGGSQQDAHSPGFSWFHNYWCNLMAESGINGEVNKGRPFAFAAIISLVLGLCAFWYFFFDASAFSKLLIRSLQLSVFGSMAMLLFIYTGYHDLVINVAGGLGLVVLSATEVELLRRRDIVAFKFGLCILFLILLNNLVYYSGDLFYLPFLQKITTLAFLCWVLHIHFKYLSLPSVFAQKINVPTSTIGDFQ